MGDFEKIYSFAFKEANSMGSKYIQLLEFEYEEIKKQGAEQYWIDIIKSKKKFKTNKNMLVLPFLLKLTNIDPTPDSRIDSRLKGKLDIINDPGAFKDKDMPDIDLDFISEAKDAVIDYAAEKYGEDKVCSVGLWQTYKPRSSLKDVAKSLGYSDRLVDIEKMTKELPDEFDDATLKEALDDYQDFKEWYHHEIHGADNRKIASYAFRLVGKIKTQGKHAGGLIVSSVPLSKHLPIAKIGAKGKEKWTSEWTEGKNVQLSKFGFVKYDVLGLKTMQYVFDASQMIKKNHGVNIDWDEIGYDDEESYKTANELKTDSIFQFDTDVAKGILSKGGVKKLTDILVYTSLGRPGPMPMVDEYILRRDSEDPHTTNEDAKGYNWKETEHPKVLALLGDTLGITVFQEQVSALLTGLAGFTLPEAEKARKIMSKKWKDQMVWVQEKILKGFQRTLDNEVCPLIRPKLDIKDDEKMQAAKEVDTICDNNEWTWSKEYWKRLETFARYSFNKAHAVAYAIQCYRCLYLKTHFPAEWWSAVLNTCNRKKQPKYIQIAKPEGTEFGSLDINKLSIKFDVVDGKVAPGLLGIKGIGVKMTDTIDTNINDIKDVDDFITRQINNKIFMERVIKLGAFDNVHGKKSRKSLWYWYLYKHCTTAEAKEIKEEINKIFAYTPLQIEEIREQMYFEHKKKHPKSKKIPKRILNFEPKLSLNREQIFNHVKKAGDYTLAEKLDHQKEFLDYHWDSPMDLYGSMGGHTIKNAMENGILECVVSDSENRRTSKGSKFLTLSITDGTNFSRIQIWSTQLDEYGEDYFAAGTGLNMRVDFNEKYKSFNLKKDYPITKLPSIQEQEKISKYIEDTEVFPYLIKQEFLEGFSDE